VQGTWAHAFRDNGHDLARVDCKPTTVLLLGKPRGEKVG
jgi:hypothetical protein